MTEKKQILSRLTKAAVMTVGGLYGINQYIDKQYLLGTTLSYGNGRTYSWNKTSVYYRVIGEGKEPILLVHDASVDSSGEEWRDLEDKLRKSFRIYTIDLPGTGRSDKKTSTYTNFYYVQLLNAFTSDVIGRKTIVVTSGLSGSFAIMAARAKPQLFSRIFMISPTDPVRLRTVPDRQSRSLRMLLHLPVIGKTVYYIVVNERNIERKITRSMVYDPSGLKKRTIKRAYDSAHAGKGEGKNLLASREGNYLNWNIEKPLHELTVPVEIIYGAYTKGSEIIVKRYQHLNRRIVNHKVDRSALLPQIENPDEVASIILGSSHEKQNVKPEIKKPEKN